jgi:hypothetical protein
MERLIRGSVLAPDQIESTACWLWALDLNGSGYGRISVWVSGVGSRKLMAHIVSWRMFNLDEDGNPPVIPDGHHVDHLCRTRCCINPDHLEVVTIKENMQRRTHWHRTNKARLI